jgi:hypothetical protein
MKRHAAVLLAALGAAAAAPATLAERAAALRADHDSAHSGKLLEYLLARSGLDSCARALRGQDRGERELECGEAERRIAACEARRESWTRALDQFTLDAIAAGQQKRHATLIRSSLPPCPGTLPDSRDAPGEALTAANRRDRQALPGYPVCESYLRAMIGAADEAKAVLVEGLAQDLVERCGAEHPDYRRQANAALIRVGLDPALLDRPRPPTAGASAVSK